MRNPRTRAAVLVDGDSVSIFGSSDPNVPLATSIERAAFGSDGLLGDWIFVGNLPFDTTPAHVTVQGDRLHIIGATPFRGLIASTSFSAELWEDWTTIEAQFLPATGCSRRDETHWLCFGGFTQNVYLGAWGEPGLALEIGSPEIARNPSVLVIGQHIIVSPTNGLSSGTIWISSIALFGGAE
jgi:hypothetical protein